MNKMDSKLSQKPQRFHELDILRFLAALAVVFFHYTFLNATEYKNIANYPFLSEFFKYGYLGVELFFMISGFVILLSASNKDWREFIVSRLVRLFPAFWIAVTLTTIGIVFFAPDAMQVTFSQYLFNLTMMGEFIGVENIDPVYWTLQIELKFYFWIVLILFFKKIKYIENIIIIWLVFAWLEIYHFGHELTHFALIPEWAPYFSAGALFYIISTQGATLKRVALVLIAYFLSMYFAYEGAEQKSLLYDGVVFSPIITLGLISLFFAMFSFMILSKSTCLNQPWVMLLGALSYPLYLVHQKLGQIAYLTVGESFNKYIVLFVTVLSMITIAYLLYRYFEVSLAKKLKRKITNGFLNSRE